MNLAPKQGASSSKRHLKCSKETLWDITHCSRHIPHIWRHVSPLKNFFGAKDILFNPFGGIFHLLRCLGVRPHCLRFFSTYLEASSLLMEREKGGF
jgi:hypothetical protein